MFAIVACSVPASQASPSPRRPFDGRGLPRLLNSRGADGASLQQLKRPASSSEWWPASNRYPGRHQIGIGSRIASEFALPARFVQNPRANRHD